MHLLHLQVDLHIYISCTRFLRPPKKILGRKSGSVICLVKASRKSLQNTDAQRQRQRLGYLSFYERLSALLYYSLGVGEFYHWLASQLPPGSMCKYCCSCLVQTISPYNHLLHFYHHCANHYGCSIQKLPKYLPKKVINSMYSFSRTPVLNLKENKTWISTGGPKAVGE